MIKMATANCGHTRNEKGIFTDWYGYTWCSFCSMDDTDAGLDYCTRVSARLKGGRVYTIDGLVMGVVQERTTNSGARTPTGGRHSSDRMTISISGSAVSWYANAPKPDKGNLIVLRRS